MKKVAIASCKSCRHFTLDSVTYTKHAALGLGHCQLDVLALKSKATFRPLEYRCTKYDATDVRKAWIAEQEKRL